MKETIAQAEEGIAPELVRLSEAGFQEIEHGIDGTSDVLVIWARYKEKGNRYMKATPILRTAKEAATLLVDSYIRSHSTEEPKDPFADSPYNKKEEEEEEDDITDDDDENNEQLP